LQLTDPACHGPGRDTNPKAADDAQGSPPAEGAPETLSQGLPVYPDSAIADGVACTARFLYHIETDGSATVVRLEWDLAPPPHHVETFESAIRDAVATWRFVPAFQLVYKETSDGKKGFEKPLIPKAGRALIRFRVEDGRGIVE
jgi:hypothetical protein